MIKWKILYIIWFQILVILLKKFSDLVDERALLIHGFLPTKLEMNEISRDLVLFFVISEYNFGSFSLFCVISTVSAQHHQCDPITLVKAISWIHYSITCKNVYAVIPSEYVSNSLSWFDEINGLYLLLIQEEFIYSAVNCLQ